MAVACNTGHAWHAELQQRFPHIEVLHVAREVAHTLAGRGARAIGLLATEGTYRAGLYDKALAHAGLVCHIPVAAERDQLMRGIYQGFKVGDMALARNCFAQVAEALDRKHGLQTLILGCTEIPLALSAVPGLAELELMDPAALLAHTLACRAYASASSEGWLPKSPEGS